MEFVLSRFWPYCFALMVVAFSGCEKLPVQPEPPKRPFRTVMVYMGAHNNLAPYAIENMNAMEAGLGDVDGELLVYARIQGDLPAIYRISSNNSPEIESEKIKVYNDHNSSDPAVMKMVFDDMKRLSPAETYGAVLWSHATGWAPVLPGKLMSFGADDGYIGDEREMSITQLKDALPADLDFILFDACSMASVEVLYELRDKARYVIASPAEVISNGMPYASIINDLFDRNNDAYIRVARKYFDHYDQQEGLFRSATISVFDMSQIERVALASEALFTSFRSPFPDLRRSEIQRMDFDRLGNPLIAFDFVDFVVQNFGEETTEDLRNILDSLVLYKANTPSFNGYDITINEGISCYIPHSGNEILAHHVYRQLSWYRKGGFHTLF